MRICAPITYEQAVTDTYLGADDELYIDGARSLTVGFRDDADALVDGMVKVRWGDGSAVEVPIPADNLVAIPPVSLGCDGVLPEVRLDGKVAAVSAGGDTLIILVA